MLLNVCTYLFYLFGLFLTRSLSSALSFNNKHWQTHIERERASLFGDTIQFVDYVWVPLATKTNETIRFYWLLCVSHPSNSFMCVLFECDLDIISTVCSKFYVLKNCFNWSEQLLLLVLLYLVIHSHSHRRWPLTWMRFFSMLCWLQYNIQSAWAGAVCSYRETFLFEEL